MRNLSFKRIGLLLLKYFVENKRREIVQWASIAGLTFFYTYLLLPFLGIELFVVLLLLALFMLSVQSFSSLSGKEKACQYLLLPASSLEKTITNILLTHLYLPISFAIAFLAGFGLSYVLPSYETHKTLLEETFAFSSIDWSYIRPIVLTQAIMLFASVYFRKRVVVKLILASFLFSFLHLLIILISWLIMIKKFDVGEIILGGIASSSFPFNIEITCISGATMDTLLCCVGVAFCWVLSYFRLRETEV